MRRRTLARGAAAAVASLSIGLLRAQPLQKVKLHLYPGALISLVGYVAAEQATFRKHGTDIEPVTVTTGPDAIAALLSGGVDVMLNSGDNLMRAIEKGSPPMKGVAGNVRQLPASIVASNDIPVVAGTYEQRMKSLVGKKMGVLQRGASTEILFRSLFTGAGLDPDRDATWIGVGLVPTAIPALQNKVIDAYFAFEPFQTSIVTQQKTGHLVVDMRRGEGPPNLSDVPYNFHIVKTEDLTARADLMRRVAAGFKDTHAFMQSPANLDLVVASAAKYIKMDAAALRRMVEDNLPTYSAAIPDAGLAKWIALGQALGIKRDFKPADLVARELVPA